MRRAPDDGKVLNLGKDGARGDGKHRPGSFRYP
jgi:hypothetical protein